MDDWVATGTHNATCPSGDTWTTGTKLKGRLRLGSRSVIFDPDDLRVPIYKFPLGDVESIEENGEYSRRTDHIHLKREVYALRSFCADSLVCFCVGSVSVGERTLYGDEIMM